MKPIFLILLLIVAVWLIASATIDHRTAPAVVKAGVGCALLAAWHCLAIGRPWK